MQTIQRGFCVALSTSDPVVASLAQDIFKELSQIEACQGPMQMRLIPTLVSIMQAPADKIPAGLCAVSGHEACVCQRSVSAICGKNHLPDGKLVIALEIHEVEQFYWDTWPVRTVDACLKL